MRSYSQHSGFNEAKGGNMENKMNSFSEWAAKQPYVVGDPRSNDECGCEPCCNRRAIEDEDNGRRKCLYHNEQLQDVNNDGLLFCESCAAGCEVCGEPCEGKLCKQCWADEHMDPRGYGL
jgi:hypothetical protein